jgi:hypothetical protein
VPYCEAFTDEESRAKSEPNWFSSMFLKSEMGSEGLLGQCPGLKGSSWKQGRWTESISAALKFL